MGTEFDMISSAIGSEGVRGDADLRTSLVEGGIGNSGPLFSDGVAGDRWATIESFVLRLVPTKEF